MTSRLAGRVLVVALGLVLSAVAVPASGRSASSLPMKAQAGVSISGTVAYPAGFTYNAGDPPWVSADPVDGSGSGAGSTPSADGAFVLDGLEAGTAYYVSLAGTQKLVWGYYSADGTLVTGYAGAAPVTAPASGITLRPQRATTLKGTVLFPEGYRRRATEAASILVMTDRNQLLPGVVRARGRFTVPGMAPGARCIVRFTASGDHLENGYFTGGRHLSSDFDRAKPVTAPAARLVLRPRKLMTRRPVPTVTGGRQVGMRLRATPGTWGKHVTLTYRWLRDYQPIAGATKPTYTITPADAGRILNVAVTGRKKGYAPHTEWSSDLTVAP